MKKLTETTMVLAALLSCVLAAGADRTAGDKAAKRLGEAGPAAERAIPAMIEALKEEARRPKAESELAATTEEGYADTWMSLPRTFALNVNQNTGGAGASLGGRVRTSCSSMLRGDRPKRWKTAR